jgi:gliding motility-associated-like protein
MIIKAGKLFLSLLACSLLVIPVTESRAQCGNLGVEDSSFTGWLGATGTVPSTVWSPANLNMPPILANDPATSFSQFSIMYNPSMTDPNAINTVSGLPDIPVVAPGGGNVSVRLGNENTGAETERISYNVLVTQNNTSFTYQYAIILENPAGHTVQEQPRFTVNIKDQNGNLIGGQCGTYTIDGLNAASDPTFLPFTFGYYRKWTQVGIDLTSFIGQTITIEFITQDCTLGGHYGYAYVDATCSVLSANINFCPNDNNVLLAAPAGYASYQWHDNAAANSPIAGATNDTLIVTSPTIGDTFSVVMTSVSGCPSILQVVLNYTNITTNTTQMNNPCFGDNQGTITVTASNGIGPFTYELTEISSGNITTSPPQNGSYTFSNLFAGTYVVYTTTPGGCEGTDTVTITQPPAPPDTVNIKVPFCPDDAFVTISLPENATCSGCTYNWYKDNTGNPVGNNNDSLTVNTPAPGDVYIVQVQPPVGCPVFDTIRLEYNPPDPLPDYMLKNNVFTPNGDNKNDRYEVFFPYTKTFHIEIYNRWGLKVFESDSFNLGEGWDGKINGKEADEGVYFWMATYTSRCNIDQEKIYESKGFVHLLR